MKKTTKPKEGSQQSKWKTTNGTQKSKKAKQSMKNGSKQTQLNNSSNHTLMEAT